MFQFKGTAADSSDDSGLDWRVVDHTNIQDLGRRPFTTMLQPAHHQRTRTEGTRRPSLRLRSRSNSSAPNYSRPQDRDDLSPPATPYDRRTPQSLLDRRSVSGGSINTRGDSLDSFTPKAWMAKGSRFLRRQNSKQELTSLRTLDWVEDSEKARLQYGQDQPPPPHFRFSKAWSTDDPGPRLNISEPFNFHHVTHTKPHHVQRLESADPDDLISEFSALRASQASQPELRGIKAEDIQREGSRQDSLLPDSPSPPRNLTAGLARLRTSNLRDHAQDSFYSGTSFVRNPTPTDNFPHPSSPYHISQYPQISPSGSQWTRLHYESPTDETFSESLIPTAESPEPLDYPIGTWNDGVYDLASPHAVTTDDGADWNRQVPFSMVKTELAPVEEGDEDDERRSSMVACNRNLKWGARKAKSVPTTHKWLLKAANASMSLDEDSQSERAHPMPPVAKRYTIRAAKAEPARASHASMPVAEGSQSNRAHPMSPSEESPREWSTQATNASMPTAEDVQTGLVHPTPPVEESPLGWSSRPLHVEDDVFDSLHRPRMPPATISEPSIEDAMDDIPVRSRLSRHLSVGPNDMDRLWDMASDAIDQSYALGAEGDSHFDWHRSSIHEHNAPNDFQANATDTPSEPRKRNPQPASPHPSMTATRRSSSVYSNAPTPLLPLQTSPSKLEPLSACSTEASFSSVPEAATPDEGTLDAGSIPTRFCTMNCKDWCRPAYIVSHDAESPLSHDDLLYHHQMYNGTAAIDCGGAHHDVPFPLLLHSGAGVGVGGRGGGVEGSTMSNSPRSSRSPISKSSSQESFLYNAQSAAFGGGGARRPRNAGSIGSLPELVPGKSSGRGRVEHAGE